MTNLNLEQWPVDRLVEYACNPRKNDPVVDRMCGAIREFGFRIPIVARSDGTVVDGHLRLKAARKLEMAEVPVVLADDLSETQVKAFRILANQSANWASWDDELLALEFEQLREADFDLELTGFDLEAIEALLEPKDTTPSDTVEEEVALPTQEITPISKLGDLWILDEHRLLCGDSCQLATLETVLAGEHADMTACDPPYNVAYGTASVVTQAPRNNSKAILNDSLGEDFPQFIYDVCVNILTVTKGAVYICMAASEIHTLYSAFLKAGGHWSTFIIWAKHHFALGRSDYHRQYEPILYGWKKGNTRHWCGDRDQSDIWECEKPAANRLHPTMKPVALIERMITNSSKRGDIVLDPFGGSGTTLIACENTKRKCRTIELDPAYCDVIIRRWQSITGKQAILAADGKTFEEHSQA